MPTAIVKTLEKANLFSNNIEWKQRRVYLDEKRSMKSKTLLIVGRKNLNSHKWESFQTPF
jgi:hypothetical protein